MFDISYTNNIDTGYVYECVEALTSRKQYSEFSRMYFYREQYNNAYTYTNVSNFDIIQNILVLFQDNVNVYNRLKDIFQDDDIKNDQIKLNKQSFYSLFSWINSYPKDFDYSIGVSNDGCATIQHNDNLKYIYIKFYKDVDVFYNVYAKSGALLDVVSMATLSDFYKDYKRLCSIVG